MAESDCSMFHKFIFNQGTQPVLKITDKLIIDEKKNYLIEKCNKIFTFYVLTQIVHQRHHKAFLILL